MPHHPRNKPLAALLNALVALATGFVVWLLVFLALGSTLAAPPPLLPVFAFAAIAGVLGFVVEVDRVLCWFAAIWRAIGRVLAKLI